MKKVKVIILILFQLLNFICCSKMELEPFIFGNVEVFLIDKKTSDNEFYFANYAYYSFDFCNLSQKNISEIEISYILQLNDKKRKVKEVICHDVNSNEKINFKFNLDIYLCEIPEKIIIENFSINKIKYTDNSVWKNYFF